MDEGEITVDVPDDGIRVGDTGWMVTPLHSTCNVSLNKISSML